jgi:putative membrane protein
MHDHHLVNKVMNHEFVQAGLVLFFIIFFLLYVSAVIKNNKHRNQWPLYRTLYWALGVLCSAVSMIGPLAEMAHVSFIAHMTSHLLLGMVAPLFIVLASPVTLLLRSLPVAKARLLTTLLKKKIMHIFLDPLVVAILNIGGLWLLYTTDLYMLMHQYIWLFIFIHLHLFLAGYLFTTAILSIEPVIPKNHFWYRALVLVIALAAHGILSKYIYGHPPEGVPIKQAESGGVLMYYGGDLVDIILIFLLCLQWYNASRPKQFPFSQ